MIPNQPRTKVEMSDLGDYIDTINQRLKSLDQPLVKAKYTAESIKLTSGSVQVHINKLDMFFKNKLFING